MTVGGGGGGGGVRVTSFGQVDKYRVNIMCLDQSVSRHIRMKANGLVTKAPAFAHTTELCNLSVMQDGYIFSPSRLYLSIKQHTKSICHWRWISSSFHLSRIYQSKENITACSVAINKNGQEDPRLPGLIWAGCLMRNEPRWVGNEITHSSPRGPRFTLTEWRMCCI